MKISARNVFQGNITALKPGAVNAEVEISLGGHDHIVAIVTNGSVESLGLAVGKPVTALIKASSVLVMTDGAGIALSARNILTGTISSLCNGQVNSEVAITLASGAIVHATITHDAVEAMELKQGAAASAVFKASSVIIGVPC